MKLIEAMKQLKDLSIKAKDLRDKIRDHCADLEHETPPYPDQKRQVREWLQAHDDVVQKIMQLRIAIQKTNLATKAKIELGGVHVERSVAEWIHRRGGRDKNGLAKTNFEAWSQLTDRGLKDGKYRTTQGQDFDVRVRRYFDPGERDSKLSMYREEPSKIDATLEIVNAVTDLIE